ncbi:FAD-dependent oxidoreductase [Halanaerobium hydrogeniformans]|uniref:FAD-dependent pyridine nucleotide-disulfide oxidoreductase n=1 Tax=Halanaerobium hydrogeniformans TaxID=656519 RepID=E4RJW3_HALHG|nr:FAD-dependent oxidoreductase [Halanaerobium hydrogeniformans]ADQ15533.1 FAD-dependent pyridine nucleotide-disulfide oxidoreductase [Halanaerobium hydrogeniformans]
MKIAVIGGVAAGTSAAAKARRTDPDAEIVIFEKGTEISYGGCGLPYYISGLIPDRDQLIAFTGEEFEDKYGVEVRLKHEVREIDSHEKMIYYKNLATGQDGAYQYDKLIIATGASPIKPPFEGFEKENIFVLRSVKDGDRIKAAANRDTTKKAVIIGAGLIGLEMAEAFTEMGLKTTVIELQPQVLPPFSQEMAKLVEKELQEKDVDLVLNDGVAAFKGGDKLEKVVTESGKEIEADLALLSIGVKANSELAKKAGIEIGETGAIKINEKMETNLKDIYAAGDCAESKDLITGKAAWIPLGSTANKQGRTAGENAAGGSYSHSGIIKTGITKIFDLTAARTGLSKEEAEKNGFEVTEVKIKARNHAGYYPGADIINIKGVFANNDGRLLGAEVIGGDGSDKRIDVLVTAIQAEMTAADLFQLDLAYAPPYSSAKDAVAILGMVAEKKL